MQSSSNINSEDIDDDENEEAERMANAFPTDLEMRIQLLEETGVDALKDLVDFYSRRERYAGGLAVWGGWLVDDD